MSTDKNISAPLCKEHFLGYHWYPAIETFFVQGYCEVSNEDFATVMDALERLGFDLEASKGQTDATTHLCGSYFQFPSQDNESSPPEEHDPSVAEQILIQLGGRRFAFMTGSKKFVSDRNTLRMNLVKNRSGANRLHITLNGKDLYNMRFFYYRGMQIKAISGKLVETPAVEREIQCYEDIYCDMLCSIFTEVTGLYTHL